MGPVEITSDNYSIITMSETPVVVCLASSAAGQGLKLIEAAKKLGAQTDEELLVATVDIDAQRSIAQSLGAKGAATVVLVQDGYVLARTSTASSTKSLEDFVSKAVARNKKAAEDQQVANAARNKRHWWHRL